MAQVVASAAVNGASFIDSALTNGKLAPGGLFVLFGTGLGPAALAQAGSFPLGTVLAGTSLRASVGDTSSDCLMIYASDKQVAAILPSDIQPGHGTLTVSYNGRQAAGISIDVIPRDFGIFAASQNGGGQGVITDPFTNILNSLISSAHPGQVLDIWGTGLGAVTGNEGAGPLPGDIQDANIKVFVDDEEAQVLYRGRSGCCAGVDQIRFVVPAGVSGCFVPLHLEINDLPSNYVTLAVASSGPYCDSPGGPTANDLQTVALTDHLVEGTLLLSRTREDATYDLPRNDYVESIFIPQGLTGVLKNGLVPGPHVGGCSIRQPAFQITGVEINSIVDTGQVMLTGPLGTFNLYGGGSLFPVAQQLNFIPGYPTDHPGIIRDGTVLTPGMYTFTSSGGTFPGSPPFVVDVPPFTLSMNLPEPLEWTNSDSVKDIDRSKPLTITWRNGVSGGWIGITGTSVFAVRNGRRLSVAFVCWADAAAGSYTIPPGILSKMPPSAEEPSNLGSSLHIEQWIFGDRFEVSGVDAARRLISDSVGKAIMFR